MRRTTNLRTRVFLTFLIGYLTFLPTGPYPLYVGGLRIEYVLFALVCGASLALIGSVYRHAKGRYGRVQLYVLAYLAVIGLATALSSDPELSMGALLITLGYAYLMWVIPPLIYRHLNVVRAALLWLAAGTSALLIYLYAALGYGGLQRFTLADSAVRSESDLNYVDPNMTAIGMMMCVVIALPILLGNADSGRGVRRTVHRVLAVVIVGAALFLESRTAAVSMVVAVVFGIMRAGSGMLRSQTVMRRVFLILAMVSIGAYLNRGSVLAVLDRMSNLETDTISSTGRLSLFQDALDGWSSSSKTVIIGNGYFTSNPHNEFLRTLSDDGLVGVTAFIGLLFGIYSLCCRGQRYSADQTLAQNALFAFIITAMMTYGHTKTMWVAFIFLLAGHLEAQARPVVAERISRASLGFIIPGMAAAVPNRRM
jgi:O-antigen ligase